MKTKKAYIVYEYNEFDNDFKYLKEYNTLDELLEDNKKEIQLTNKLSLYNYMTSNIENIKEMLHNKYIIIKEDY